MYINGGEVLYVQLWPGLLHFIDLTGGGGCSDRAHAVVRVRRERSRRRGVAAAPSFQRLRVRSNPRGYAQHRRRPTEEPRLSDPHDAVRPGVRKHNFTDFLPCFMIYL